MDDILDLNLYMWFQLGLLLPAYYFSSLSGLLLKLNCGLGLVQTENSKKIIEVFLIYLKPTVNCCLVNL